MWTKALGSWVPEDEVPGLEIIHSDIFYCNISYHYQTEPSHDDECLGEVSYFPSSERDIHRAFIPQAKPKDGDDILYVFESWYFIHVVCGQIELTVA